MQLIDFFKTTYRQSLVPVIIGAAAFALVLVLTLNLSAALLSLILIIAITIFQHSFSRGWLFLFAIITLIPTSKIGAGAVSVYEVLLTILALVGLVQIVTAEAKVKLTKLHYFFFLMVLTGLSSIVFGKMFQFTINPEIIVLTLLLGLFLAVMFTFGHFFQTKKRIRRFIVLLVTVGTIHSGIGIISYLFGWQSPGGKGITKGTFQLFSENLIQHQINGLLGNGYLLKVGENALAPLLLITIPLTISLLLLSKKLRPAAAEPLKMPSFQLFDSIHTAAQKKYWIDLLENSSRISISEKIKELDHPKFFLSMVLLVQIAALLLTFSYPAIVILGIGIFIIAVLLRHKIMLSASVVMLVVLALVIPSIFSSITIQSEQNISQWLSGFDQISSNWMWGSGWRIKQSGIANSGTQIFNSYLYIWHSLGLIGFAGLLATLVQFFRDLRKSYLASDSPERIWLIAFIAIFFEFLLFAITSNCLFFGPAAIAFWLLTGAAFNLRKRTVVFGLTETRLRI